MAERAARYRPGDPYVDGMWKSAWTDDSSEDSIPLFLSDPAGEPDPAEYLTPSRQAQKASISLKILGGVVATAIAASLFALLSSDGARDIVVNVKASAASVSPVPSAAAQSDPLQGTRRGSQLSESPKPSAPENAVRSLATAPVGPTREQIKAVYQSALQAAAPREGAVAEPAIAPEVVHHLDANEIASSLRRGEALIASGDFAAARLVLRRAAEGGSARAALSLAETYDPTVLEKRGVHGVVPDFAMARAWYEKAKQFGATEAAQLPEPTAQR